MKLSTAIDGFIISMDSPHYSKETARGYKGYLTVWSNWLEDPEITTLSDTSLTDFLEFKHGQGVTGSTLRGYWRCFRTFYRWVSVTLKMDNLALDIPMPPAKTADTVIYTRDEIKRMISACDTTKPSNGVKKPFTMPRTTAKRDKAILVLLVDTGMRVGELTRICMADIVLKSGYINIRPYETQIKTRGRPVFLSAASKNYLWQYMATREDAKPSEPLFISRNRRPLGRSEVLHLVKRIGDRAGVPGVHPHAFRHTFAVEFLRNGGNIKSLMDLLGHINPKMTLHYSHLAEADARNAHKKFSPMENWVM